MGGEYETGRYTNTVEKPGKVVRCIQELFFQHNNEELIDWSKYRKKIIFFGKKVKKKNNKKDHRALIQVQGQILGLVVGSPR